MLTQWLARFMGVSLLCLAMCAVASAQYGGGSMGSGGTTGAGTTGAANSNYSYGSGKAIGIGVGVAAAAAVGVALLIHHHHAATRSEASVIGCTQSLLGGISLRNENDNQTFMILSKGTPLEAGERVQLKGIVTNSASEKQVFQVHSLVKNYGTCKSAAVEKSAQEKGVAVQVSR
jgi:hypothetical protein